MVRTPVLLALIGLLLATVASVEAQQVTPAINLAWEPRSLSVNDGEAGTVTYTLTNTGQTAGAVTLTIAAPAGWSPVADATSPFNLAAGAQRVVRVTVTPSTAATAGSLDLTARIADQLGQGGTAASNVALTYVPPPPVVPAPAPPDRTPIIVASILVVLVLIGIGLYLLQARTVELSLEASARQVNAGTDGIYQVRIRNRLARPVQAQVRIKSVPVGWVAAVSYPTVELQAHEARMVPLLVRVPLNAPAGAVGRTVVEARPNGRSPWLARAAAVTTVIDVSSDRPAPGAVPA